MRRKIVLGLAAWKSWITIAPILLLVIALAVVLPGARKRAREAARPEPVAVPAPVVEEAAMPKKVFTSTLAGRWYEADAGRLTAEIDGYLANVETRVPGSVQALILPHAGYRYSGQVAAYGVKQVAGNRFSRVVVMGPTHQLPMEDVASVPDATHYATPLGEVPLDVDFINALKQHPHFRSIRGAHDTEHSVQIEVPLLQRALGDFTLVPIVVGQLDAESSRAMARVLAGLLDPETLVAVSSDFTHYGRNFGYVPFRDDVLDNLEKLDMGAWDFIEKKDLNGFYDYIAQTGATICGRHPIGLLLAMLPADSQAHLIKYDTSGKIMGDTSNSVSYLSIAFTGTWKQGKAVAVQPGQEAALTEQDRAQLLALARATLECAVKNRRMGTPEELGITITPGMERVMGAFVTLTEGGQLRGCIGDIFPRRPLYKAVMANAVNAGLRDNRFRPVQDEELPLLHYEISALTDPVPIPTYNDIIIGRHGMVVEKEGRSAVYLPQVAPEQGWDLDETLTHLSQKAGLQPDAWREGASFTVFEAIVFGEEPT